ncbi:hypothetical protein ABIC89_001072 [Variovorax boronicumulans]|uniref:hypothetical protein n=1 Tax=Variovorax boronicumulans TaxID=436515 RepID=UPI00339882EA
MNPYVLLALFVGWGASVGGAGWYGIGIGEDRIIAKQASDDQIRRETREDAQQGAAAAIAANKPINNTIVQKVQHEIRTERIYTDCRVPATGMQLANQAITGQPAELSGGVGVSTPNTPKR